MATILLGNSNPQVQVNGASVAAAHINQSVTRVELWDGIDDQDFVDLTLSTNNDRLLTLIARELGPDLKKYTVAVGEVEQILGVHAAGDAPTWYPLMMKV